jgi:S-DNA-T family DNA segregation ATPase FtsK/SpoIIIE
MGKNTYKSNTFKSKKKERKKRILKFGFLKDRRLHLTVGIFLLTASFFLLTAFISYLFTGKADQSVVEAFTTTDIKESGFEIENWFGLLGAISSHYFIYKWFGIASFFIPPFLFLLGTYILFDRQLISIKRSLQFILFFIFWLSTLFGYITLDESNPVVFSYVTGGIGFEIATILHGLMGWGTYIFLIFLFIIFVIYFFNITSIIGLEKSLENLSASIPATNESDRSETTEAGTEEPDIESEEAQSVNDQELESEQWEVSETQNNKPKPEPNLELAIESETEKDNSKDDLPFEIDECFDNLIFILLQLFFGDLHIGLIVFVEQ